MIQICDNLAISRLYPSLLRTVENETIKVGGERGKSVANRRISV